MIHKEKLKREQREAKYGVEARATRAFEKVRRGEERQPKRS